MQIAVPSAASQRVPPAANLDERAQKRADLLRVAGLLCLVAIVAAAFLLAASAASGPSEFVRVRGGLWPSWMAGPYEGLGLRLSSAGFDVYTLALLGCYLVVLASARTLPAKAIGASIALAYLAIMLGPPLLSQDVYGYLSFARLGAIHGLDPYTHVAAEAPADPTFAYIGWPFQHTPYGPLFTLGSYAIAPLGFAAGLWSLKAIAVLCSLGAVALTALAAKREGRSGRLAAAFVGLNPVMIEFAVGGAHNDTITLLLVSAALVMSAAALRAAGTRTARGRDHGGAAPGKRGLARLRAATVPLALAAGFKITGGLMIPFLVLAPRAAKQRLRLLADSVLALVLVAIVGAIGFGFGITEFVVPLAEEQQQVSPLSVPAEIGRIVGLSGSGAPSWWRAIFLAGFVCVLLYALWRTANGADWRVAAGWSTFALVISTAWLLPWYAIWALPLAAVTNDRRLRVAVLVFCLYALMMRLPLTEPLLG